MKGNQLLANIIFHQTSIVVSPDDIEEEEEEEEKMGILHYALGTGEASKRQEML